METELTPTAREIAEVALAAYTKAGGIGTNKVDELSKAQIAAFNSVAEWHEGQLTELQREIYSELDHRPDC